MKQQLTVPATLDQLRVIRDVIEEVCRTCGVEGEALVRLLLATDEICSNIIRHGYQNDRRAQLQVEVECTDTFCRVTVRDDSPPFDPIRAQATESRSTRGGHGLRIANQAALLQYQPKGETSPQNVTTITVELHPSQRSL